MAGISTISCSLQLGFSAPNARSDALGGGFANPVETPGFLPAFVNFTDAVEIVACACG